MVGEGSAGKPQGTWDSFNRPRGYILGVTPGFASFRQGEERMTLSGIARKIMFGARQGFDFVEVDFESIAEAYEHGLGEQVRRVVESQGPNFGFGIHGPVTGRLALDLGVANANEWEMHHRNLQRTALAAKKTGAKFILFHTSHNPKPGITYYLKTHEYRVPQYSFTGQNLAKWMEDVDDGKFVDPATGKRVNLGSFGLVDWFKARFIRVLFNVMGSVGEPSVLTYFSTGRAYNGIPVLEERVDVSFEKLLKIAAKRIKSIEKEYWEKGVRDKTLNMLTNELVKLGEELKKTKDPMRAESIKHDMQVTGMLLERVKRCVPENFADEEEYTSEIGLLLESPKIKRMFRTLLNGGVDPTEDPGNLTDRYREYNLYQHVYAYCLNYDFGKIYEFWKEQGSEAEENVSYQVTAKYMSKTGDFLWKEIVEKEAGCDVDPDLAIDLANQGVESYPGAKIPVSKIVDLIITAVACKYIQGHLLVKTEQWSMGSLPELTHEAGEASETSPEEITEKEKHMSVYEFCKENKIHIFVETEQPSEGLEGKLRIMHAHHHVALVKSIDGGENVSYNMDFEHLTTNLIDPIEDVVRNLDKNDGKYIRMVHINAPKPYGGLHGQIQLFSLDMYVLYKWLWELRSRGMKNAYLIWEWGAAGPPEDSATALRSMIKMLENDVPPEKLPPEFYGMGPEFEAQQYQAIFMHAMDPVEGLITFPEHTFTFFGERAKALGRLSQWLRNRFK